MEKRNIIKIIALAALMGNKVTQPVSGEAVAMGLTATAFAVSVAHSTAKHSSETYRDMLSVLETPLNKFGYFGGGLLLGFLCHMARPATIPVAVGAALSAGLTVTAVAGIDELSPKAPAIGQDAVIVPAALPVAQPVDPAQAVKKESWFGARTLCGLAGVATITLIRLANLSGWLTPVSTK